MALAMCASIAYAQRDVFPYVAHAHFLAADACWQQEKLPTIHQIQAVIVNLQEAARRWWPECPDDAAYHLFTLGLTEGGGNVDGVDADPDTPSYNFFHIKEEAAKMSATFWKITPYDTREGDWFRSTLRTNIRAGVLIGAGYVRILYNQHGGDWTTTILHYKYGTNGLERAINGLKDKSVSDLKVWRRYDTMYMWVNCIRQKVEALDTDYCDCMGVIKGGKR